MIGKSFGHYKILEQLGRGGMGEVYLAEDLSLNRKVALKFLPDVFTGDSERMARFEREAKLLASLNHPNIAAIYGLEQADGKRFLIMEYVEGETLQSRIGKGALPLDEALAVCRQIAEGLEAAHEKGVIHRDLKPANVMITGEEKVKILDFGLAKALLDEGRSVDSSQSPTITEAMTQPGVVLGTAAYMSPEQAKGKAVDKRADIWAFGCILYECLTGKRVFEGETVTETLAAVIKEAPDWEVLPPSTQQNIRFVLRRCMEKERNRRFRDAADVQIEIEEARDSGAATEPVNQQHPRLAWGISIICLIGLLAMAVLYYSQAPNEAPVMRLQVITPRTPDPSDFGNSLALSPDGRYLVFVGFADDGQAQLWLRSLDDVTASPIEGTEGARLPFWSSNSRLIGFFAGGKLKRIDVAGGTPMELADAPDGGGGTWNRDGVIVFAPSQTSQLFQVSDSGVGEPVPVTLLDPPRQTNHSFPQFLPDGRHLLFNSSGDEGQGIFLASLDSFETKLLSPIEGPAFYAAPGYLLFMRQNTLFARRFNVAQGKLIGDEVWIADSVVTDEQSKLGVFSASETGMLAYRTGEIPLRQLALFDRSGKEVKTISAPDRNNIESPEISPDGSDVAICRYMQGDPDIWLIQTTRGGIPSRFSGNPSTTEIFPIWSPDGKRIVYASLREGTFGLYERSFHDIKDKELYLDPSANIFPNDWSPDGQHILYGRIDPNTGRDLWVLPLFGEDRPSFFLKTNYEERNGQFSPDGRFIAYESNESRRFEVYVKPFQDVGRKQAVSTDGGIAPRWRPDGKELFYIAPDGKLIATPIRGAGQTLSVGIPEPLFQTQIVGGGTATFSKIQYDVLPDGQHFLINKAIDDPSTSPITIVTNWARALKE